VKQYFRPYLVMVWGAIGITFPGWYLLTHQHQWGRGFWPQFFMVLSLSVLIPSIIFFWAGFDKLPRSYGVLGPLGRKVRDIPVNLASQFDFNVPWSSVTSIEVVDEIEFPYYDGQGRRRVISEADLLSFLKVSWSRQAQGLPTFERESWVPRKMDRYSYEAIMQYLTAAGFVSGRRRGNSGHLILRPERAIRVLRYCV